MDINAKHLSLGAWCMSVAKTKQPFKLKLTDEYNLQYVLICHQTETMHSSIIAVSAML